MKQASISRRNFLKGSLVGTVAGSLAGAGCTLVEPQKPEPALRGVDILNKTQPAVASVNGMPYRLLGKTEAKVSLLGLGGYHIGVIPSQEVAVSLIRNALDEGVNFLDNAWEYHDGMAEVRMGIALEGGYREKAFLMTKVCGRDEKTAMGHLEDSLRRLKTDVIDLWQFHEINYDNDPDLIFAKNGAINAAIKAKEQGKIRFIGFTGHKSPHIHLKMLRQDFPWDAVQMPINILDFHYRSFTREVVPVLLERKIGVVAMKSAACGAINKGTEASPAECLRYAMSLPISVVVSGVTTQEMARQNIETAKTFKPMEESEKRALLDKVRHVAGDGRYERFKSTQDFDSRPHRLQHDLL